MTDQNLLLNKLRGWPWYLSEADRARIIDLVATRDGADGVGEASLMSLRCALSFADEPRTCSALEAPADTMEELYEALRVLAKAYRESAPPKPEPDAMREAEHPMQEWIDLIRLLGPPDPSDEEFEHGWAACQEAVIEILSVPEIAAPVPSPDGAGEFFKTCPGCEMRRTCRDARHCYGPSHAELKERFALSPSGTVAAARGSDAEADRYFEMAGDFGNRIQRATECISFNIGSINRSVAAELKKILSSPAPARGDRKAIALPRCLGSHSDDDPRCVRVIFAEPPSIEQHAEILKRLSLPVRPGAGEREAGWQDIASAPKDQEVEVRGIWKLRGDGIEFTHWRPLSRQAPHSGSEDGR